MFGDLVVVDDVADAFAQHVLDAYRNRPDDIFSIALAGGTQARSCYERLAAASEGIIDWLSVNVYWGDERCVPPDDPDSNQLLGRQALLERVGAANAVYPMSCEEGPDAYQLRIGQIGHLDVIHLGVGPDGHTASLFPNSPALNADPGQLVALNEDSSDRNVHPRMTLTYSGIARARLVLFVVGGSAKRDIMTRLMAGEDLPANRVRAERVVWLLDHDALPVPG
jgi:6-phosphogluconolactonase